VTLFDQVRAAIGRCEEPFDARAVLAQLPVAIALVRVQKTLYSLTYKGQLRLVDIRWLGKRREARYRSAEPQRPAPADPARAEAAARQLGEVLSRWAHRGSRSPKLRSGDAAVANARRAQRKSEVAAAVAARRAERESA
jgi:hypothetical protein